MNIFEAGLSSGEIMEDKKIHIEICMGTTCFVLGASQFEDLESQLPEHIRPMVEIHPARCLGLCREGKFTGAPYVKINSIPIGKATVQLIIDILLEMVGDKNRDSQNKNA